MNILSKLSIKNIKLNKKRTISTIIGIILSVALICAVATMATSFRATLIENAANETGYYHINISELEENDIKELKNNKNVKDIYEIRDVGYASLPESQNENKPYLKLYSMNNETFSNLKFNLIEGNFPSNNNEILISEHIISNGNVNLKIGDEITLGVGKRMLGGYELNNHNPYIYDNNESDISGNISEEVEELQVDFTKTFKIVGIIERPIYSFESYSAPAYTVITTNINEGKFDTYISLKNPMKFKTVIPEILGADDYSQVINNSSENFKYENWQINNELLRWEVFAFSDSTVSMLYSVIGVVIFIIIFTSVFCIRNSFAISTIEKMKTYGMLASVGATKKQIKKNVIFEGLLLGLVGIPIGIICGIFAVFVLLKIVNMLLGDYLLAHVDGIVFTVSTIPVIISAILGIITIYLSAISSAKKASKVSPIENLRSSNDIKIKNKDLKTPKIIEKVFKTGGVLAYKNLKRSKKKYRTTVISISVSIFIFITMNTFLVNAFDLTGNYYEDFDYNFEISSGLHDLSNEQISKLTTSEYVQEHFYLYEPKDHEGLKIKDLSKVYNGEGFAEGYCRLELRALDNDSFKKYCKKIGADYEKVKDKGILIDNYIEYDENSSKEIRRYTYNEKDTIISEYKDKNLSINVGKVTKIRPYGIEKSYYSGGFLVVNYDEFKDLDFELDLITINSNNTEKLEEYIDSLNLNVGCFNLEETAKQEKSMVLVVKIFLYGFIAVITLIGVTNIFNTITSNMELRQKEFAMLKSIGMTKREFNRMINLETLFYGTKSWIYGTILGLLGTFALYKAFSIKLDSGLYIPIVPIVISAVFVFILVFIIMKYSISKINKQNTIETIRKDNI